MRIRKFQILAAAVAASAVAISFAEEIRPFNPRAAKNVAEATEWAFKDDLFARTANPFMPMKPRWKTQDYRTGTAAVVLAENLVDMLDAADCKYDRNYRQKGNVIEIIVDPESPAPCSMKSTTVRIRTWVGEQEFTTLTVKVDDKFGHLIFPANAVVSKNPKILSRYYKVDPVEWSKIVERFAHAVRNLDVANRKEVSGTLLNKYFEAAIKENPVEAAYYASLASTLPPAQ